LARRLLAISLALIPAVIVVLGVMLFLSFRHPVPALLSLMEIGVSLIWMSGLMGLTGQPVFVTTLVLPVVLICVGVSDDVYALGHYFNEAERANIRRSRRRSWRRSAVPLARRDDGRLNRRRTAFDGGRESQSAARLRPVRLCCDRLLDVVHVLTRPALLAL
jgi:hypothetical protein